MAARRVAALVFDLDGTLVDSVYQHVLAWHRALLESGIELSVWRIHRRIGMSGGLFARALLRETGRDLDAGFLQQLQERHAAAYKQLAGDVRPLPGALELLARLTELGCPWSIATSGRMETAGPILERLGIPKSVPIVTRDQVEHAKPDPDLFLAAPSAWRADRRRLRGRRQRLGHAGRAARRRAGRGRPLRRLRRRRAGAGRRLPGLRRPGRCCCSTWTSSASAATEPAARPKHSDRASDTGPKRACRVLR